MNKDYRLPENRMELFGDYYAFNLEYKCLPGMVYLLMPELARHYGWGDEQKLLFAFINGATQNVITSLRIFEQLSEGPVAPPHFDTWFNDNWASLQFDVDRQKNKRHTVAALQSYAALVSEAGSQAKLWSTLKSYRELWASASRIHGFGRLSCFSYLEYVYIMGFGTDCDDLMFYDKDGSRSHRNGLLKLLGRDDLVWDKRQPGGHDGNYVDFDVLCNNLTRQASNLLLDFREKHPKLDTAGFFTLESQLCTMKNTAFGRRYPGVYADMHQDRIAWADAHGLQKYTQVFKDIRAAHLPVWLRAECEAKPMRIVDKAKLFPATGRLLRLENYLPEKYAS